VVITVNRTRATTKTIWWLEELLYAFRAERARVSHSAAGDRNNIIIIIITTTTTIIIVYTRMYDAGVLDDNCIRRWIVRDGSIWSCIIRTTSRHNGIRNYNMRIHTLFAVNVVSRIRGWPHIIGALSRVMIIGGFLRGVAFKKVFIVIIILLLDVVRCRYKTILKASLSRIFFGIGAD